MELNDAYFWECPTCHLQAAARGIFTILRTRGSGKLRSGPGGKKATEQIIGWVLARAGNGEPDPKDAGLASIKKDLSPEELDIFEAMIDAFEQRDREQRARNLPEWLAVGSWFESEDELRSFIESEVES